MTAMPSVEARRPTVQAAEETPRLISPFERLGVTGRALDVINWLAVVAAVYVLITAVNVIGSGFKAATGDQAETLFAFATNPLIGLMIGVAATALTQSSSTTTSVTVGLVAGGLPLAVAIPIILGANIGTTLTNTLVSLGMIRDREQFRRGFAAATVHDFFNLMAVAIFLPLEMAFGILERIATFFADRVSGTDGGLVAALFGGIGDLVKAATTPLSEGIQYSLSWIPDPVRGIVMIIVAVALILLVINFIGRMLKVLMVGRAKQVFNAAIGRGPLSGIGSGALMTVMVQSSSTSTALMVPLAGSGAFTLRQVYPFTVGANIGTTVTALISAFAFTGVEAHYALIAALVHLAFNVLATLVIFGLPFLRDLPPRGATWLANLAVEKKIYAAVWVLGIFVVLPMVLIFATVIF
ncbi:Na/Pi symporter [Nesterenkonia xinjiangensis]|uniref:Sodium-dependent phosphate cotransporter n=1 Tax=Nesterenkonia xinjiangensis TaxID=225327 RepID=A0A7Z0GK48_9MICC|nr:Na/Pi symporter [Nesterenkonia xinjiangensis]NYJ77474.1 sodium-dependent phosphate cotransporter [Nesterenkonia xinjiangensis]